MKYGFIGCGNMANAMIAGMVESEFTSAENIVVSNRSMEKLESLQNKYKKIYVTGENTKTAEESDILVLSVKPQVYSHVISEIKGVVNNKKIIVSIAPGYTLDQLESLFDNEIKIIRCMPNTPAMVKAGMTAYVPNDRCSPNDVEQVEKMLSSFGKCALVTEAQMDAVTAISGSSPAYVFMFIEAMADAAVREGLPRKQAYDIAAQAVYGAAKMVLDRSQHPAILKDMVCSPQGTTIEAVRVLEDKGFRSAIIEACIACAEKSRG